MAAKETIGTTEFTTPTETELVATRVFAAPRRLVWDAHTDARHMRRWMLGPDGWSMPVCELDLRPGGAWRHVWRREDGSEMGMHGEFREVSPPDRLVNTEAWGGDWAETLNVLDFAEENGHTVLTCTVRYPSREARDRAMQTGMLQGWAGSYDRLDKYLATLEG